MTSPLSDIQLHRITSVDDAQECLRWLSTRDMIGLDTESTGLDKQHDRVRLVQIGDSQQGWVMSVFHWAGLIQEIIDKFTGQYVLHNAVFDISMLRNSGITPPQQHLINDTRLMAHVLESTGPLGLKPLAAMHIDKRLGLAQIELNDFMRENKWTWATIPIDNRLYWTYAALDPVLTMRLAEVLLPRVKKEAPRSYDLEMAVSFVCAKMEDHGVRVDREYTQKFADELDDFINKATDWCWSNYNFSPGSSDKIIDQLLRDNVPLIRKTKSGAKYSLDKEVLASIEHPLAETVLKRRQAQKIRSTYLSSYLDLTSYDDKYIHPSINTIGGRDRSPMESGGTSGVRTGRMSMSDPNLQNVPKRTKEGSRIRNCFVPSDGNVWVSCDAEQIEMRILAHLSQDPKLIQAFQEEGDFFTNMGKDLFHDPNFSQDNPKRQFVKNGGYAKIYGAGMGKFAITAGVSEEEAHKFISAFDRTFKKVPEFINKVQEVARERLRTENSSYVRSPLTQRKLTTEFGYEYKLVNYLIQGMGAEVLKQKIVEADNAGLTEYMVFPVHDELDFDVPEDKVDDFRSTLYKTVNDNDLFSVPLTWSTSSGTRWGDCQL